MDPVDAFRLDSPVYAALSGPHARFAQSAGRARRYPAELAPFLGLPPRPTVSDWDDARELVPTGTFVATMSAPMTPLTPWQVLRRFTVVQMVCESPSGNAGAVMASLGAGDVPEMVSLGAGDVPEMVSLGAGDVPEMTDLVTETEPGPFFPRTVELGAYYGIRRNGMLVAMAGERMHLSGWTEVSAVCTRASVRGQGLASALVRAVMGGIAARQERAFLHAATTNAPAIRLYQTLGFRVRRELSVLVLTRPG